MKHPDKYVGEVRPDENAPAPVWYLAQWHSRCDLGTTHPEYLENGIVRFDDGVKAITFFPPGGEADIRFAMDGKAEFNGHLFQQGDPWPHMYAERQLLAHPILTELGAVRFAIQYRLIREEVHRPDGFDPRVHAAQFLFFLTICNQNPNSPGRGDYYWFGIPMYDTRDRQPIAFIGKDVSSARKKGTDKLIYILSGETYTTQSAHDKKWVTMEKDLLPLIYEGLQTAWDQGFLKDSHEPADYSIGTVVMGWEINGPVNVEMDVKNLKLEAIFHKASTGKE